MNAVTLGEGFKGGDGQLRHVQWKKPKTQEEIDNDRFSFYKTFSYYRQFAGGPMDPLFFLSDPKALAEVNPKDIKVLEVTAPKGHKGWLLNRSGSGLGEWRTWSGNGLKVRPVEMPEKITRNSYLESKTVAVDLDGTLAEYDGWKGEDHFGSVRPGAVEAMQRLKSQGHKIIIFTTRGDKAKVAAWLEKNDIPYDHINENPNQPKSSSGKVIADVYVDDRAVDARGDWASHVLPEVESRLTGNVLGGPATIEDLKRYTDKGWAVITPIQAYGKRRESGADFLYGHYVVVIGVSEEMGLVICQDPSRDNVVVGHDPRYDLPDVLIAKARSFMTDQPADASPAAFKLWLGMDQDYWDNAQLEKALKIGAKEVHEMEDSVEEPGRITIPFERWNEIWHDQDEGGCKFLHYGIAVGPPLAVNEEKDPIPEEVDVWVEPTENANPKGCNQFTGKGCAEAVSQELQKQRLGGYKVKEAIQDAKGHMARLLRGSKILEGHGKTVEEAVADAVTHDDTIPDELVQESMNQKPVPIQRHGMTTPEPMVTHVENGVKVFYPRSQPGLEIASMVVDTLRNDDIPKMLLRNVKNIYLSSQPDKFDSFYGELYKEKGFKSTSTGGDGDITAYNNHQVSLGSFAHEAGHNLAGELWHRDSRDPAEDSDYGKAQKAEGPVSEYARHSPCEDFAEACRLYTIWKNDEGEEARDFPSKFPKKFAAIRRLLND